MGKGEENEDGENSVFAFVLAVIGICNALIRFEEPVITVISSSGRVSTKVLILKLII